jgi:hypothetical protein
LNRFEGHYIYSYLLIFKLMRKTIHVTINMTNTLSIAFFFCNLMRGSLLIRSEMSM